MEPLDDQARALIDQLRAHGFRPAHQVPVEESRHGLTAMALQMAGPKVQVQAVDERTIPGPGGPLPIRIYRPQAAAGEQLPAVLYFHGGGFYLGSLDTHDHVCRFLCRHAGAVVVAVDYRLAPEHKFPAAVEDCYAALCWMAGNTGALDVDAGRVAVAGDSAGGTLAVTTCLLARARGGPTIACQVAVYPALALTDGDEFASRRELGGGEYFIAHQDFAFFRTLYLTDPGTQAHDPLASPIYAEHFRGLPPALLVTAGYDPCRDEAVRYAERLETDGVPVVHVCFERTIHPFFLFDGVLEAGREGQRFVAGALRCFFADGRWPAA